MFSPPASQLFASDPIIDYLKSVKEPGRVLALQLSPQTGCAARSVSVDGSERAHGARHSPGRRLPRQLDWPVQRFDRGSAARRAADLASAQRAISAHGRRHRSARRRAAARGPREERGGIHGISLSAPGGERVRVGRAGDREGGRRARARDGDSTRASIATRAALVDSAAPVSVRRSPPCPQPTGIAVHTVSYAPGHIVLQLAKPAPAGSALVVSENYYPGWKAIADGKDALVVRTDYSLMGVVLPAGATRVELTFTSPAYEHGKDAHAARARARRSLDRGRHRARPEAPWLNGRSSSFRRTTNATTLPRC